MLKLKLQYFGHLMPRADSLEKTLRLGKIEGRGRRGQQRMRWLDGIANSMDMSWWWTGKPGVLQSMGRAAAHGVIKSRTWLSDWTEVKQHSDQLNISLGNRNETLFLEGRVYLFVTAATTKHHRLSDKQKFIFSQFWRLEVQDQGVFMFFWGLSPCLEVASFLCCVLTWSCFYLCCLCPCLLFL